MGSWWVGFIVRGGERKRLVGLSGLARIVPFKTRLCDKRKVSEERKKEASRSVGVLIFYSSLLRIWFF